MKYFVAHVSGEFHPEIFSPDPVLGAPMPPTLPSATIRRPVLKGITEESGSRRMERSALC